MHAEIFARHIRRSRFNNIIDTKATVCFIFEGIDFNILNMYKVFVIER
jgi:hypothetical protein